MKLELSDDLSELLEMVVTEARQTVNDVGLTTGVDNFARRFLMVRLEKLGDAVKTAARDSIAHCPGPIVQPSPAYPVLPAAAVAAIAPKPSSKTIKSKPIIGKKVRGGEYVPKVRTTPNWTEAEDKILLGYEVVTPKPWNDILQHLQDAGFILRNQAACEARLRRLLERREEQRARAQAMRVREDAFTKVLDGTDIVSPQASIPVGGVDATSSHPDILQDEWRPRQPKPEELMGKGYGR